MKRVFSPGSDRSPGGSLSVLVKQLCSLSQSCRMSPPECILSSGPHKRKAKIAVSHRNTHSLMLKISTEGKTSPSSGDRDSATSSVAVAWNRTEVFFRILTFGSGAGSEYQQEVMAYVRRGWAAGEHGMRLSIGHLGQLLLVLLLDGR